MARTDTILSTGVSIDSAIVGMTAMVYVNGSAFVSFFFQKIIFLFIYILYIYIYIYYIIYIYVVFYPQEFLLILLLLE